MKEIEVHWKEKFFEVTGEERENVYEIQIVTHLFGMLPWGKALERVEPKKKVDADDYQVRSVSL
jgi:hypothetical protein